MRRPTCEDRDYCKLLGWRDKKDKPKALPATPDQMGAMAFSYLRDKSKGFDKALWNCALYKRADPRDCMKVQFVFPTKAPAPDAAPTPGPRATLSLPGDHARERPNAQTDPGAAPDRRAQPPPNRRQAANASTGSAMMLALPPSILRRSAPVSGSIRSA